MTMIKGSDLHDLSLFDPIPVSPVLHGSGFMLQPTGTKIFRPTGAPVHFYDVMTGGSERVGIASLVLEADVLKVAEVGHACAKLSEAVADPDLLRAIAGVLISHGFDQGLKTVRVVVPTDHQLSIQACEMLSGECTTECLEADGKKFVGFEYSALS